MKTKKKNNITMFTIFAVILTVIALIATSGTYAKYTSSLNTVDATAKVAKWNVVVTTGDVHSTMGLAQNIDFDLFKTVLDTNQQSEEGDVEQPDPNDPEEEDLTPVIAPGTSGVFDLGITNNSDVTISYGISLTETNNSSIPIKYALETEDGLTAYTNASGLAATIAEIAADDPLYATDSETFTIHWKWDFVTDPNTDAADTALGLAARTSDVTYAVRATITATQID